LLDPGKGWEKAFMEYACHGDDKLLIPEYNLKTKISKNGNKANQIILANLDPTLGSEIKKTRLALSFPR